MSHQKARIFFETAGMRLIQRIAGLIAPPVCALCGAAGQWLDEPFGLDLCPHCQRCCRAVPDACPRCGLPGNSGESGTKMCPSCMKNPPEHDAVHALFQYEDPVDFMITRLKFGGEPVFARVLGTLFARCHRGHPPDCLIPLPLHRSRLAERGFCQTTALARHIAARLAGPQGRPPLVRTDLLRRTRATRAQSGLDAAARAANLAAAFAMRPGVTTPRSVALVDDVMTTGHTAAAATRVLKQAGVERVEIWCCARALRMDAPDIRAPGPIW